MNNILSRSAILWGLSAAILMSLAAGMFFIIGEGEKLMDNCRLVPDDGKISRAGQYCLNKDLVVNRDVGIQITASDVHLDLRGYTVRFDADTPKPGTYGILISGKSRATVQNGIVSGWWYGIHTLDVDGITISDMKILDIGYIGFSAAETKNLTVSGSFFSEFRHDIPKEKDSYLIGMNVRSKGCRIFGNTFDDRLGKFNELEKNIETVHILMPAGDTSDCIISGNRIAADRVSFRTYGIWIGKGVDVVIRENEIENHRYSVTIDIGAKAVVDSNRMRVTSSILNIPNQSEEILTLDSTAVYSRSADITILENELSAFERPMTLLNGGVVEGNRILPATE